jgi:hypothetical protein
MADAGHDVSFSQEGLEGFVVPLVLSQHLHRHFLAPADG